MTLYGRFRLNLFRRNRLLSDPTDPTDPTEPTEPNRPPAPTEPRPLAPYPLDPFTPPNPPIHEPSLVAGGHRGVGSAPEPDLGDYLEQEGCQP